MARQLVNDRQISALVPVDMKTEVRDLADTYNVSDGEVIRLALEYGLTTARMDLARRVAGRPARSGE